jgi:hypothetical protein
MQELMLASYPQLFSFKKYFKQVSKGPRSLNAEEFES